MAVHKPMCFKLAGVLMLVGCHVGLGGCASQVPQPVSRDALIVVPTAIVSIEPQVSVAFDPRDMIPIIGMPLNSIGRERTEDALKKQLDGFAMELADVLSSELAAQLSANGHTAHVVPSNRARDVFLPTFGETEDLPAMPQPGVVIDVLISVWGACAESLDKDYQPLIAAVYRVVDAKTHRVLWRRTLAYNSPLRKGRADNVPGDPSVHWKDKKELMADTDGMMNALREGGIKLGAAIAADVVRAK